MFIPDPDPDLDFKLSRIPGAKKALDPGSATLEETLFKNSFGSGTLPPT
jgi:hypothetical protein